MKKAESGSTIDFDVQMQANLSMVFNERDADKRIAAIGKLYAADAILFEPSSQAAGHAAINAAVTELLEALPSEFTFRADGPAVGHHGLGRLRWQSGPPGGPVAVSGMDIAHFETGLIKTLHVFIEPGAK